MLCKNKQYKQEENNSSHKSSLPNVPLMPGLLDDVSSGLVCRYDRTAYKAIKGERSNLEYSNSL